MRLKNIARVLALVILLSNLLACSNESSSNRSESVELPENTADTAEINSSNGFRCAEGEPVIIEGEDICQFESADFGTFSADSADFGVFED